MVFLEEWILSFIPNRETLGCFLLEGHQAVGGLEDKHSGGIAQKKAAATIVQRPFTSVCYEKFERMKLHSFGVVLIILF